METKTLDQRTQTVCLLIISSILVGAAMYWLEPVLVPFVLALFLTFCLTPVIGFLQKKLKIPRTFALVITVLLGILVFTMLVAVVLSAVNQMQNNWNGYLEQFRQLFRSVISSLPLEKLRVDPTEISTYMWEMPKTVLKEVLPVLGDASMGLLSDGTLIIIFMMFLMIGQSTQEKNEGTMISEIESRVKRYIIAKVLTSALTGLLVGLTLWILKVDFALVFAVFTFFLNFIPNIGSLIATLLPLPVVLLSKELSITAQILAIFIPGLIQFVVGNVLEPRFMGEALDLHPITIILSLIFFGMLWSIPGMLLAAPITAVIKIILERSESGAVVAEIMAGRLDVLKKSKA